jgi:hypothetical protein
MEILQHKGLVSPAIKKVFKIWGLALLSRVPYSTLTMRGLAVTQDESRQRSAVAALSDDKTRSLAAASGRIQTATGDSYKSFKVLLEKHDPNAQDYGEASCIAPNRAIVLSPSF